MKNFLFILIAAIVLSCSPQKRLARLLVKHPELVKTDTIMRKFRVKDSVIVPGERIDTSFYSAWSNDTAFGTAFFSDTSKKTVLDVTRNNLSVKIQQAGKDKYQVSVIQKKSVIQYDKEIPVPVIRSVIQPVIQEKTKWKTFVYYGKIAFVILFALVLFTLLFRIEKWRRVE